MPSESGATAAKAESPLPKDYTTDLTRWDPTLHTSMRHQSEHAYDEAEDRGWVQYPKLFRRIVKFHTEDRSRSRSLRDFLQGDSQRDRVFLTGEFLEHGPSAPTHSLASFIDGRDRFLAAPSALIFREAASTLYGDGGQRVLEW